MEKFKCLNQRLKTDSLLTNIQTFLPEYLFLWRTPVLVHASTNKINEADTKNNEIDSQASTKS